MTRQEHLDWCKTRALEYVDRGDFKEGVTSMMSDLGKHDETKSSAESMGPMALFEIMNGNPESARRFITGFN